MMAAAPFTASFWRRWPQDPAATSFTLAPGHWCRLRQATSRGAADAPVHCVGRLLRCAHREQGRAVRRRQAGKKMCSLCLSLSPFNLYFRAHGWRHQAFGADSSAARLPIQLFRSPNLVFRVGDSLTCRSTTQDSPTRRFLIGRSLFYFSQLLSKFAFLPPTIKPGIQPHQSIKTVHFCLGTILDSNFDLVNLWGPRVSDTDMRAPHVSK